MQFLKGVKMKKTEKKSQCDFCGKTFPANFAGDEMYFDLDVCPACVKQQQNS